MTPLKQKTHDNLLKIILILGIVCCCAVFFPEVRNFIIETGEKVLGQNLNHEKWMERLLLYPIYAIYVIFLFGCILLSQRLSTNQLACAIMLLGTVFVLELIFSRNMIFHSDNIVGDSGDSRLVSLIMEHWYKVFHGQEAIRDLSMFYPVKNTLGYSDALFLLALPYSLLRAIGLPWLKAYQFTLIATHLFGGICLAWFLWKNLKLPLWTCMIALIIGNFSNSYYFKLLHTQFVTTSLVPLLLIFLYNFYINFNQGSATKRKVFGVLSIILFSGILLTSFYVGYFTAFFLLIVHIIVAIYLFKTRITTTRKALNVIRTYKLEVLLYIAAAIVVLLPFVWIYMPVFNQTGGRGWGETLSYLPYWNDFFSVSSSNLIWSSSSMNSQYELQVGYPLITAVVLILACVFYIKQLFAGSNVQSKNKMYICITIGFSFSIAIISLLILRINYYSFWFFVYKLFPGASAMRAVGRFNQFLSLPAAIVIAFFLAERIHLTNKQNIKYALLCMAFIAPVFLEHQNTANLCRWTKSSVYDYLENVSTPPNDCEAFFLVNNTSSVNSNVQLDAWTIAHKYNLKTINGYSGQFPQAWNRLWNMENDRNYTDLWPWIQHYNLENVYLYDRKNNKWIACTEQALEELATPR